MGAHDTPDSAGVGNRRARGRRACPPVRRWQRSYDSAAGRSCVRAVSLGRRKVPMATARDVSWRRSASTRSAASPTAGTRSSPRPARHPTSRRRSARCWRTGSGSNSLTTFIRTAGQVQDLAMAKPMALVIAPFIAYGPRRRCGRACSCRSHEKRVVRDPGRRSRRVACDPSRRFACSSGAMPASRSRHPDQACSGRRVRRCSGGRLYEHTVG